MNTDDRLKQMFYDDDNPHTDSVRTALSGTPGAPESEQSMPRGTRSHSGYSDDDQKSGFPGFLLVALAIAGLSFAAWYWYPALSKMITPDPSVSGDQASEELVSNEPVTGDQKANSELQADTAVSTTPAAPPVVPIAKDAIAPLYDGEVMDRFRVDVIAAATAGTAEVDPAIVVLEGLVPAEGVPTPVSILSTNKKSLNVVGEGTWSVSDDGSIVFASIDTFQKFPTSISFALVDSNSPAPNTATVLPNPLTEQYSKDLAQLLSASDEDFWKYYEENLIAPYPPLEPETIIVINRMFWRATRDKMGLVARNGLLAKAKIKDKNITNIFLPWGAGGFTTPDLWNMVSTLEVVDLTSSASPKPKLTAELEDRFIRLNVFDRLLRHYMNQK